MAMKLQILEKVGKSSMLSAFDICMKKVKAYCLTCEIVSEPLVKAEYVLCVALYKAFH